MFQACLVVSSFKDVSYHFQLDVPLRQIRLFVCAPLKLYTWFAVLMTLSGAVFAEEWKVKPPFLADQFAMFAPSFPTNFRRQTDHDCSFTYHICLASPTNVSWFWGPYMCPTGNHRIHVDGIHVFSCVKISGRVVDDLCQGWRYVEILNKYIYHLWPKAWLATPQYFFQITISPWQILDVTPSELLRRCLAAGYEKLRCCKLQVKLWCHNTQEATI